MPYFVEVVLPLSLPKTFTYAVSETEFHFIKPGMRIVVPFGKSKLYTALAIETHQRIPQLYSAKEIYEILDEFPIVHDFQIKHWFWISEYYMCHLGDVYKAALPSSLLLESETLISAVISLDVQDAILSDDEYLIVEALQVKSAIYLKEVNDILNKKNIFPVIQKLIDKGYIKTEETVKETYKPKQVKYIRISKDYEDSGALQEVLVQLKNAKKQMALVLAYFQIKAETDKPILPKQLTDKANATNAALKLLEDKNIFEVYFLTQNRTDYTANDTVDVFALSDAQQEALQDVKTVFEVQHTCLLHGITSSGKTAVYIALIHEFLKQKKQVLFLLPEIALTTQLVSRLRLHFGNKIAVYHSKYSNSERVEVWRQVLTNAEEASIIVGARSSLFLPFSNLGLVIVDEEHEQNFKQTDPAPRYHARDAAAVLAQYFNAKLLLGSATPSLETYYNTKHNKFGLVALKTRYGNVQLPDIVLVDLKEKYFRKQMNGHFSDTLIAEITSSLALGEQIILFQNRRGFAPLMECMTCGHIPQCPQCDVSLTYHKYKNQLRCHYCGHAIAKPTHCHSCSSIDLTTKGFGTEQIELELASLFPTANIMRMDQDTTKGKFGYDKILNNFQNRTVDILIGTQMLAKGLDFDNVSLVGIMNADNMLYHPDFRAFERSFQMMIQVAGRAGRAQKKGKVIIQTFNPLHSTIQQVTRYDYDGMYEEQIYDRSIYKYPPFFRIIKITLKQRDYLKLKEGAFWLYQVLVQQLKTPVLGPEEPVIGRIRNEYIREILIKIPSNVSLKGTKKTIQHLLNSFESIPQYRSIKISINVDMY